MDAKLKRYGFKEKGLRYKLIKILRIFFILLLFLNQNLHADSELFKAAKNGNNAKIIQLLSEGANIDERDKHKWTPLFEAISWGKTETVKLLVSKNSTINISNDEGNTPLHMAAFLGHLDVVKLLLKNNSKIDAKNNDGQTALHLAASGKLTIVKYLLKNGAQQIKDKYGNTISDLAYSEKIKELLKN